MERLIKTTKVFCSQIKPMCQIKNPDPWQWQKSEACLQIRFISFQPGAWKNKKKPRENRLQRTKQIEPGNLVQPNLKPPGGRLGWLPPKPNPCWFPSPSGTFWTSSSSSCQYFSNSFTDFSYISLLSCVCSSSILSNPSHSSIIWAYRLTPPFFPDSLSASPTFRMFSRPSRHTVTILGSGHIRRSQRGFMQPWLTKNLRAHKYNTNQLSHL